MTDQPHAQAQDGLSDDELMRLCDGLGVHATEAIWERVEALRARVAELEQEKSEQRRAAFLDWRGIEKPCVTCGGTGLRTYGSTAVWRGGIGGQVMTTAHCNACWGSGDAEKPWVDLRKVAAIQAEIARLKGERS